MGRKYVGMMGMILCGLMLSLELFGLKLIQTGEMAQGHWYPSPFRYVTEEPVCGLALAVIGVVLLYCVYLTFSKEK